MKKVAIVGLGWLGMPLAMQLQREAGKSPGVKPHKMVSKRPE